MERNKEMFTHKLVNPIDQTLGSSKVEGNVWSDNSPNIRTFFSSSTQVNSTIGSFHVDIYSKDPTKNTTPVEFSIGFADKNGRGSVKYRQWGSNSTNKLSPTATNYYQIKTILEVDDRFTFGDVNSDYFYIINVERSGFKEYLATEGMTLTLSKIDSSTPPFEVKRAINLTNDAAYNLPLEIAGVGDVYQMILGEDGVMDTEYDTRGWTENRGSYGWFIPQMGIILLNGRALDEDYIDGGLLLDTNLSYNVEGRNTDKLFEVIDEGGRDGTIPNPNLHKGFTLSSGETLAEKYMFINAGANDFNYSNNPSFTTGKEGDLRFGSHINDPEVYITTIGLYNDRDELVSVAKLSQPLPKTFAAHNLLRIKLDF